MSETSMEILGEKMLRNYEIYDNDFLMEIKERIESAVKKLRAFKMSIKKMDTKTAELIDDAEIQLGHLKRLIRGYKEMNHG